MHPDDTLELDVEDEGADPGAGDAGDAVLPDPTEADQDVGDAEGEDEAAAGAPNAWQAMKQHLSDLQQHPTEQDDEGAGEEKPETESEGEGEAPEKGKPAAETAEKPAMPSRFAIVDGEGNEYEAEWPEGTRVRFAADGRPREVGSMDELVQLAQKGVAFDRRSSEWGQAEKALRTKASELAQKVGEGEELLLRALFDKDAHQQLRKALGKYRDPDVRAALRDSATLRETQERQQQQASASREQVIAEFWPAVRQEIQGQLEAHEYLRPEDEQEILSAFHHEFIAEYNARYQHLAAQAAAGGYNVRDEQVRAELGRLAEAEALPTLTEARLSEVMGRLNSRYAQRTGGEAAEARAQKEAERHNRRTEDKVQRRGKGKQLRGTGGAPPAPGRGELAEPTSWDGHLAAMRRELRGARG